MVDRSAQIASGLAQVRSRIDAARQAAGRVDPVRLVVVTKTFPATDVEILAELGVTDVAENRDQEARTKREVIASAMRWHMVGQVQRNKAVSIGRWADVVESIDRPEVLPGLARGAAESGRQVDVLIQVSLDPPALAHRGGVRPAQAVDLAAAVDDAAGLRLSGVMGVAPHPGDPAEAFGLLRDVAEQLRSRWPEATTISAGMSEDLEQAIAHGATQVRIGGAVLGHRARLQ